MTEVSRRRGLVRLFALMWASPWSALGVVLGLFALASGGGVQTRRGVLEFYGGFVAWLLERMPVGAMAMTLGHVVIGRTAAALDVARDHEFVHVRQYERWGPLFVPAYLGASLYLFLVGRNAYRENPFEVEAYRIADVRWPDTDLGEDDDR